MTLDHVAIAGRGKSKRSRHEIADPNTDLLAASLSLSRPGNVDMCKPTMDVFKAGRVSPIIGCPAAGTGDPAHGGAPLGMGVGRRGP